MKEQFGIEVSVKVGRLAANGYMNEEFIYQRKVTGCVDMRDAERQTLAILQDCEERLTVQVARMHPLLTNEAEQ